MVAPSASSRLVPRLSEPSFAPEMLAPVSFNTTFPSAMWSAVPIFAATTLPIESV